MIRTTILAMGLLCALAGPVAAQAPVTVEAIKAGPDGQVAIFDASGKRVGALPLDAFPKAPFPAAGYDTGSRRVKVATSQGEVWLAPFHVRTSERAGVITDCQAAERMAAVKTDAGRARSSRGLSGCQQ
ncbi:hypothetical protein [Arenibaculum pallidiluteum]|uniref:hypothetical protein n=1 Tax=Arenibaculum pallidiluteum TaxID=2812559 RepID=UPI001A958E98|nr:hypothetical protein [Arenibaculum pallidiluteum]